MVCCLADLLSWVLQSSKLAALVWVKMANVVSFTESGSGVGHGSVLVLGSSGRKPVRSPVEERIGKHLGKWHKR